MLGDFLPTAAVQPFTINFIPGIYADKQCNISAKIVKKTKYTGFEVILSYKMFTKAKLFLLIVSAEYIKTINYKEAIVRTQLCQIKSIVRLILYKN